MTATTDALPDDPGTLKAMLLAERVRAERLEQIIKELQRYRFGPRAETLSIPVPTPASRRAAPRRRSSKPAWPSRRRGGRSQLGEPQPTIRSMIYLPERSYGDPKEAAH